jgi:excinuclease ABC subunit C
MCDETGTILYVGKALDLKKRVTQYFQKNQTHPKTLALIKRIKTIEVTITRTETEALLLESNLIKTHLPKYNILLRDDKSYPYIVIDTSHAFPSMTIYRSKHKPKKGKVFGPFTNTTAVHETLNLLQKCFQIRNCRDTTFASRSRPCLQYQIKRCTAPCTAFISKEAYTANIKHALNFLSGKSTELLEALSQAMEKASHALAFEEAARLRDQLQQLRGIQETQAVVHGHQDTDVIVIQTTPPIACIEHVKIRNGNILDNQAYFPRIPIEEATHDHEEQWRALFEAFCRFYYLEQPNNIPNFILTQPYLERSDIQMYESAFKQLSAHGCQLQTRARGGAKGWIDFALNNLALHVKQHITHENQLTQQLNTLTQHLNLNTPIQRLECFDISHTQGQATIASCVVFTEKGPDKSSYRQFSIIGIQPGDDYAALRSALTRHFSRRLQDNKPLPDVLLIDGGKGQVNIAQAVLTQLQLESIRLLGITKGEGRKAAEDRIYDAKTQQFLSLQPEDTGLHFLQYLRNEAHRFAIQAHRKKRAKTQLQSTLETIEGIGPTRRKKLLQYFGGLQGLTKASIQALTQVPGISPTLAQRIFSHFNP